MLHLLPLRWLLKAVAVATALGLALAAVTGTLGPDGLSSPLGAGLRVALLTEGALWLLLTFGWSYIPGFRDRIFPDIGGTWTGVIKFSRDGVPDEKAATLHIHQDILALRLLLETDESESETLVARPERDKDFSRFTLFYIYENKRKEGVQAAGRIYRGTAFIVLQPGRPEALSGSYFTEQGNLGTLSFTRDISTEGCWAAVWRKVFGARGLATPTRGAPLSGE